MEAIKEPLYHYRTHDLAEAFRINLRAQGSFFREGQEIGGHQQQGQGAWGKKVGAITHQNAKLRDNVSIFQKEGVNGGGM